MITSADDLYPWTPCETDGLHVMQALALVQPPGQGPARMRLIRQRQVAYMLQLVHSP